MVEFLLVAFILAVGLLGLGALQVATVRGGAGTRTRMTAAALATSALEAVLAEARMVFRADGLDAQAGPDGDAAPAERSYTAPGQARWEAQFDVDGQPVTPESRAFYTVTVRRMGPAVPPPAGAPVTAREFQASVAWLEQGAPAAAPVPRHLAFSRLIAY